MKKRIISITIFVLSFFTLFSVKASERYSASDVNRHLQRYNDAVSELSSLNCDEELNNQSEADKCNRLNLQKATALSYMYNAKEYDEELATDEVNSVLDSNSSECNTIYSQDLQNAINKVFLLFYIAGPILLILFGSLDLTKAIVAGDESKRKKLYNKFIRRSIALALLFVSPAIVNLLVNTFGADKYAKQTYSCSFTEKKATIKYTPVLKTRSGGNGASYSGTYGVTSSSTLSDLSETKDRDAGKYVVVATTYPGGITGFQEMITANGICQTSTGTNGKCISSEHSPNGWGDCCAGFAQVQACGLKKGLTLTQSGATMNSCNSAGGSLGCGGIWDWGQDHCFNTEAEYVSYIISYIQQGTPVLTVTGTGSRHFVSIVGFKEGTNGTNHEDLLLLDSWDGRLETYKKRKIGSKDTLGDSHPCSGKSGKYWAAPLR